MAPRFVRNLGKWNVAPTYKFWTIDIMLKSRPYAELYFNGATQILKKVLMMEHCPFRVMNPWHWIWNLLGAESKSRPSLCLAVSWGVKRHLISFLLWADTWLEQSLGTFMAETWVYFFQSCLRKKCAVCSSKKFISLIASLPSISKRLKAENLTLSSFKWASSL